MNPVPSPSNSTGKVKTELKLSWPVTSSPVINTGISKHGTLGPQKSDREESTESCTWAHLFQRRHARDLAGDPQSLLQRFVLLGKGLNLSYQNSELEEVPAKTLIGYQKTNNPLF